MMSIQEKAVDTVQVEQDKEQELSSREMYKVILAACAGSLIEWYDFFTFGAMSTLISSKFYNTGTPTGDTIAWLASFAVGFLVRPFGALVFGVLGDLFGRKYTFLICLILMGLSTTLVGALPTIDQIGTSASILLIILRITQGLAIGGEYGGAATYIAESCPARHRGFYTSFLQITATLGLLVSLLTILAVKSCMSSASFSDWGWRIPFLLSALLILLSFYIRRKMQESPVYARAKGKAAAKQTGRVNPLKEAFTKPRNLYYVTLSLFGAVMGMACIWYTAQFYTMTYLQTSLQVSTNETYIIMAIALLAASPLFIIVGWASDIYGRKPFMLLGLLLATLTLYPLFWGMTKYGAVLYPPHKTPPNPHYSPVLLCLFIFLQVCCAALAYGPLAAFLVELFPTNIRYTCLSVPYHIGAGVFGGLVPVLGLSVTEATGDVLGGVWFPLVGCGICGVIMFFFVPETLGTDIEKDD